MKVRSAYIPTARWPNLAAVTTTDWEPLGELCVHRADHDAFLLAFDISDPDRPTVHPGVTASVMLGALRNSFPLPEPARDTPRIAWVHADQQLHLHRPFMLGDVVQLVGRLSVSTDRRYHYDGRIEPDGGEPIASTSFVIQAVELQRFTSR